ncbi:hypothetical protein BDR03DRAFT_940115 [Suillus americanus]|nr:hypothetical protein BDR03DRAFT_940115 [Suillus americanus]
MQNMRRGGWIHHQPDLVLRALHDSGIFPGHPTPHIHTYDHSVGLWYPELRERHGRPGMGSERQHTAGKTS